MNVKNVVTWLTAVGLCLLTGQSYAGEPAYNVKVLKVSVWDDATITTDNNQKGICTATGAPPTVKMIPAAHPNFKVLMSMLLVAQTTGRTVNLFLTDECVSTYPTIGMVEIN